MSDGFIAVYSLDKVTRRECSMTHFEGRDLPEYAEHVPVEELQHHRTYFIVEFNDDRMLIPSLRPVVFVGRNLLEGDSGKVYFQDYESFSEGSRHDVPPDAEGGRLDAFLEHQCSGVYEYERALDALMRCSIERRTPGEASDAPVVRVPRPSGAAIQRAEAIRIQGLALAAIESLTQVLDLSEPIGGETSAKLKKGVGFSIGFIETEILSVLYQFHPDLDPLR